MNISDLSLSDDLTFQLNIEIKLGDLKDYLDIIQDFDPAGFDARDLQVT